MAKVIAVANQKGGCEDIGSGQSGDRTGNGRKESRGN